MISQTLEMQRVVPADLSSGVGLAEQPRRYAFAITYVDVVFNSREESARILAALDACDISNRHLFQTRIECLNSRSDNETLARFRTEWYDATLARTGQGDLAVLVAKKFGIDVGRLAVTHQEIIN
ncbi:hypothetical protein ACIBCN_19120 [Nocardia sp. NPDC051052]|uniref:hypothetical protein n=1 Tax=Nocardia sp. NPDC051052 TaxID=3364322 RepID=UPI0037A5A965